MELYFSPLACSLATRISALRGRRRGRGTLLRRSTRKPSASPDGGDFFAINPMGQVPVLRTDDGELLTENAAVLQYVAERFPEAGLAPATGWSAARLQRVAGLHRHRAAQGGVRAAARPEGPGGAKAYAAAAAPARLERLDAHLTGREYLLDRFSVAGTTLGRQVARLRS